MTERNEAKAEDVVKSIGNEKREGKDVVVGGVGGERGLGMIKGMRGEGGRERSREL